MPEPTHQPITIEDIPHFDADSVADRLAARWGWLGKDAAKGFLDVIAPDIQKAIDVHEQQTKETP
jgi:hypothetical protein